MNKPTRTIVNEFKVSRWVQFRRWAMRTFFRQVFHILMDIRIIGVKNIPQQGGYIIAYNHISLFEPPFILAFWPVPPEALSGADVFDRPGQGLMVRGYAALPVHRGKYDRKVVETMVQMLRADRPLAISPEGGRSHEIALRRALPGVAYLMDQARAPVLPVGIVGGTNDLLSRGLRGKRPKLEMRIGKPFMLPLIAGKGKARRQARQDNADSVMHQIAALLPMHYRGIYTDKSAIKSPALEKPL